MSRLPLTLGVAATVVAIDQITKAIAVATLEGQAPIPLLGDWFGLTFVRNPGAAFSLAGNYTIVISAIAIGVALFIVRTARTLTSSWWAVVLGGILGGAIGNLLDRIFREPAPFRGHVVDFLELPNWPIFNVADMALVGSAVLAVILSIAGVELSEPDKTQDASTDGTTDEAAASTDATTDEAAATTDATTDETAASTDGTAADA